MIAISQFWCCLNPREQAITAACLPYYIASLGYIPQEDFYALWAAFGKSPTNKLVGAYIALYALTAGEVTDIEGNVTPVFFFGFEFWFEMALYAVNPGFGCASLCKELTFTS